MYTLLELVRRIEFPAYSSKLNPMEILWDPVKEAISNQVWQTLTAIEDSDHWGVTAILAVGSASIRAS